MAFLTRVHQRTGSGHRLCQDRYRVEYREDRLILTAADGHGAPPYTRSGLGARFACAAASEALRSQTARDSIPAAIKDRYDALVAKHLSFRPLQSWELERLNGRPQEEAYGTTILSVRITPAGTEIYQLGDGEIHLFGPDGSLFPPLPEDELCQGSMTTSLCNSRELALDSFRMASYTTQATGVLLFTDGCEGGLCQAAAAFLNPPELDNHLVQMMDRTNHGDDQTCLLVFDPEEANKPEFRDGLALTLENIRAEAAMQKQKDRDQAEYRRLHNYLELALNKALRMNPEDAAVYLYTLKPQIERYLQLHEHQ